MINPILSKRYYLHEIFGHCTNNINKAYKIKLDNGDKIGHSLPRNERKFERKRNERKFQELNFTVRSL